MAKRHKRISLDLMKHETTVQDAVRMGYAKVVTSSDPSAFNPPCLSNSSKASEEGCGGVYAESDSSSAESDVQSTPSSN